MDPESKLFYRKLLDFGPGVGFREGLRKFEEEKRIEDEVRSNLNQDIAMNPNKRFLNNYMKDKNLASHHFFDIPEDVPGFPKKEEDLYKNIENLDDPMDFDKFIRLPGMDLA